MSLSRLIAPVHRDVFYKQFWEHDVLHVERNNPSYFNDLRSSTSVDEIIWRNCHEWGEVSLAGGAGEREAEIWSKSAPTLPVIRKAFEKGYTIVINDLQNKDLSVGLFCRKIEAELFCRANVNLYLTGAEYSGLDYHYDDDDVFVLQLQGSKTWCIFNQRAELPLRESKYQQLLCNEHDGRAFILRVGDVMYIPRGVVHRATARDETSVHLTISLHTVTWFNVLQEVIQLLAEDNIDLRKSVQFLRARGCGVDKGAAERVTWPTIVSQRTFDLSIERAQRKILSRLTRLPYPESFFSTKFKGENYEYKVADDQIFDLVVNDERCVLMSADTVHEFDAIMKEPLQFICQLGKRFLPGAIPRRYSL